MGGKRVFQPAPPFAETASAGRWMGIRTPRASTQAIYLGANGRETVIAMYENRVNDDGLFRYQDQQVSYRYIFQLQAQAMARLVLGEAQEYTSFTVR